MSHLHQRSIQVILENQAAGGSYIACPTMADYAYCWFRDSTFIAYAMDLVGEHDSASRFYAWGAKVINAREAVIEQALRKTACGEPLTAADYLHTRYTLDGAEGSDAQWPNFQLDGIGTWLWGVHQHSQLTGIKQMPAQWAAAAALAARYLAGLWQLPNYDCWEEFGDKVHLHTLAAIYGGLRAYDALLGQPIYADVAAAIRDFVLSQGVVNGHFVKYLGTEAVDASLLGLATPYGLVSPDHPLMKATVAQIESDLRPLFTGVYRYAQDTYYGGGQWLLLTAWLGWHYTQTGETARARALFAWVEAQADEKGFLAEQVAVDLISPQHYQSWVEIRGSIANPLLWSHAMYLVLANALSWNQATA